MLAFFVVTRDAFVVNLALPAIKRDLGGGITGQQWVVDGYTLMFAALLLSAGALCDRIGARQAFRVGLWMFVAASAACALAPGLGVLVAARLAQGAGAAVLLPASLALLREAYSHQVQRARAIAPWSFGASVASSAGPVVGGFQTLAELAANLLHQPTSGRGGPLSPLPCPALAAPSGAARLDRADGRSGGNGG